MNQCELDLVGLFVFLCMHRINNMELLFILYCKSVLDFTVPDFRYYNSVALCALDATFSAQANYASVRNVISRFCTQYELDSETVAECPEDNVQITVSTLCNLMREVSPELLAVIVDNHQKVSGRLKSALFLDCLQVFRDYEIDTYHDFQCQFDNPELEAALSGIRGIGPATLSYLYMLAGDSNDVKVDRHIRAFAAKATKNPNLSEDQIKALFRHAASVLSKDYPGMTPRHLDHIVWAYQRNRNK